MAKKDDTNKDIGKKNPETGKAPNRKPGKDSSTNITEESGSVKGPKGVGDKTRKVKAAGEENAPKKAKSRSSEDTKKLPKAKPKKALPKTGTEDKTKPAASKKTSKEGTAGKTSTAKKAAKFKEPLTDEPLPPVSAPASKKTTSPAKDSTKEPIANKGSKKKTTMAKAKNSATSRMTKDSKEDKVQKKPAKKMSRQKIDPEISAEAKMKLPNTSPSEDLKNAAKSTGKEFTDKATPGKKTKKDLEKMAKDLIPDPDQVKDIAGKVAEKVVPEAKKAKEMVGKVMPDKDDLQAAANKAKDVVEDLTTSKTEEQKPATDKPAEATLLTEFDIHLFREGKHYHLYNKLGSHIMEYMGTEGVYFAVWAPNAEKVAVMGDFNNWNKETHQMNARWDGSGIWEVFIPEAKKGTLYKYFIRANNGYEAEKGDPYAFMWETPPNTASIVWDLENTWKDKSWMQSRKKKEGKPQPYSVYELHLGSWKRVPEDGLRSLTYRELARDLPVYLSEMGFTHVEFMPVMEHPFFGSWGYQITGYFAPSSRFGTPQDFMHLIDSLHQAEIGVILDWVPSHFPSDLHGIHYFDGTHLYEHQDPQKGFHPDWQSYIFNYGRNEVRSFLISNALFWLDKFHADGLRVDAVASMLYLDYSRKEGEWQPNEHGGRENLEAISLLKEFNEVVYKEYPDAVTIAEESTAWPMVSKPTYIGGLGFGMKWMMGWMHDTLQYFSEDPMYRRYHQNTITFSTNYAFTENFMLPLSHDEVVYGKQSILNKMPGDEWNKFANLRTLYAYMYAHPGTKLLFMGAEFGQPSEWNHDSSLEWHLTEQAPHRQIQETLKDLNKLYKSEPALYEKAFDAEGFEWVDIKDEENSIVSFLRKGNKADDNILVVCNFTPVPRENYRIGVENNGKWKEIFNSDDEKFGGSNIKNIGDIEPKPLPAHGKDASLSLTIPPMAVVYLKK